MNEDAPYNDGSGEDGGVPDVNETGEFDKGDEALL
jgi:hypothetical protein